MTKPYKWLQDRSTGEYYLNPEWEYIEKRRRKSVEAKRVRNYKPEKAPEAMAQTEERGRNGYERCLSLLTSLNISVATFNILMRARIDTIDELRDAIDGKIKMRYFGDTRRSELQKAIEEYTSHF